MPSFLTACLECGGTIEDWQDWSCHPIHQRWHVLQDIGSGSFANTVLARSIKTGSLAALKVVFLDSPDMDDDHRRVMLREPTLLRAVAEAPNVVNCLDVEQDEKHMVIVLEYCAGGQLLDHLHELGGAGLYTEQHAAQLFVQVMRGVKALHDAGILHRDIKGENVLFARPRSDGAAHAQQGETKAPRVVLIDLGMGIKYDAGAPERGAMGSPGFVAPEVALGGPHTPAMDMYSCGVLLFIMLVGRKPFNFAQCQELDYAALSLAQAPGLLDPRWRALSPAAKDLLTGMLRFDPTKRLTAAQVLQHDWVVSQGGLLPRPLDSSVAYGAANVASLRRLKNIVHSVIAAKAVYGDTMRRLQRTHTTGVIDRAASKLAVRSFAKLHDAGGAIDMAAIDPSLRGGSLHNTSRRYGGSVRSGRLLSQQLPNREGSLQRGASLKKAASALALSDLVRHSMASSNGGEGSRQGGEGSRHSVVLGEGSRRGSWRGKVFGNEVGRVVMADSSTLGIEATPVALETLHERARRASVDEQGLPGKRGDANVRGGRVFEGSRAVVEP